GGQCIDLSNVSERDFTLEEIKKLNRLKTSCLIKAALVGSLIKCGASESEIADMESYAERLGEIFQVVDDILDKTSTSEILGKDVNQDGANGKRTVVDIMGLDGAKEYVKKLHAAAVADLSKYGERAKNLISLCGYLCERTR
ncbi:MAG: polyprenyl synthetase family protein, partial [Clostridia bacterium]|nr:polyprenyl synthetase family protein [Clostridia bacterium]